MLTERENIQISKLLSLILRHTPDKFDVKLDDAGWTNVEELLSKINAQGQEINFEILDHIVKTNSKQRFAFNDDKTEIRANQGHSVKVNHGFEAIQPPAILYHGTGEKKIANILQIGLDKRKRHHVHLSDKIDTAIEVGKRHGNPIVFEILCAEMHADGFEFYKSKNKVWLTEAVPTKYLRRKKSAAEERVDLYNNLIAKHENFKRIGNTMPFTIANGHIFSQLNRAGIIGIMLSKESREAFIKKHKSSPFEAFGGILEDFISVPESLYNDNELMSSLLNESFEYVNYLPTKKPM